MVLITLQIVISLLLAAAILLQVRGTGLSSTAWGGAGSSGWRTKRGAEKFLFSATLVLSLLFLLLSLVSALV